MASMLAPELGGGGAPQQGGVNRRWPLNLGFSLPFTASVS